MTEKNNQDTPEVGTHVVTTPNKKPMTDIEVFKASLVGDYQKQITNYFEGNKEEALKFMSSIVRSVQKIPELLKCDKGSLMTAFMSCAEYKLYPSTVSGEAYVLPYKGKAQFQLGYQGIITLLYRAGVSAIKTNIVYANDDFTYEEGLEAKLIHKPTLVGAKGDAIAVYAIAVVNGEKVFKVMSKEEVLKFKEFSQAKASEYSPWNSKNDPELHMWRKTCIKQLAKILPKNDTIAKAIDEDNKDSNIIRDNRDASGIATGRALHSTGDEDQTVPDNEETIS